MLNKMPSSKLALQNNFHDISLQNKASKSKKTNNTKAYQEKQNKNTSSPTDQFLLLDVAREFVAYKKEEIGREIRQSTFRTYGIRLRNLEVNLQ